MITNQSARRVRWRNPFSAITSAPRSRWHEKADMATLQALDDALLLDIGLTRDSIRYVVRHGRLD